MATNFDVLETTIEKNHAAYQSSRPTVRQPVQIYLDRLED